MSLSISRKSICLLIALGSIASFSVVAVTDEIAIPRLVQLSRIPTSESVSEVIALASEGSTNEMRLQFAVTALIHIGPSSAGDAYVRGLLENENSPPVSIRGALAYFAERPESWVEPYAKQFLADSYSAAIRSHAAYLAGALGLSAEVDTIKSIILNDAYGEVRIEAAYGLANLVPENEMETVLNATNLSKWDKKLASQLNAFLMSDTEAKDRDVPRYLNRSEFVLSIAAMRHLLTTQNQELLKRYVVRGDQNSVSVTLPMHQTIIRMLGYEIAGNIDDLVVKRIEPL